ncbi:MAG: fibronectin type III domain-containing protein [Patescibacteria group bacterium]
MKNIKTIIIVLILLLVGVVSVFGLQTAKTLLSGAAGDCEPTGVKAQASDKSATISWQTDKESCQGVVEYGTTPASLLLRSLENAASTTHRQALTPLKPETTYYFRIRVEDQIYDNKGIPYSFKTMAEDPGLTTQQPAPTKMVAAPTIPLAPPGSSSADNSSSCVKVTKCVNAEFTEKFGTSDCQYDFDDNGVVNGADLIKCRRANK